VGRSPVSPLRVRVGLPRTLFQDRDPRDFFIAMSGNATTRPLGREKYRKVGVASARSSSAAIGVN